MGLGETRARGYYKCSRILLSSLLEDLNMYRTVKAGFTIEAVFITPLVFFIVVFIIYESFYLHDICKIRGTTNMAIHKATINLKHEADIWTGKVDYNEINKGLITSIFGNGDTKERDIENYIRRQLSKGLLATNIVDVHASKGSFELSIKVEGKFLFPLKGLIGLINLDTSLLVEAQSSYHYPADFVRISEVILETGSKIKGFDKIKDSIGSIMP